MLSGAGQAALVRRVLEARRSSFSFGHALASRLLPHTSHAMPCTRLLPVPQDEDRDETESLADGYASVASGFASTLPSGIETPSEIDLRKTSEGPKQLYTVLEQQKAAVGASTLMGSEHTYVIPGAGKEKLSIAAQVGD